MDSRITYLMVVGGDEPGQRGNDGISTGSFTIGFLPVPRGFLLESIAEFPDRLFKKSLCA